MKYAFLIPMNKNLQNKYQTQTSNQRRKQTNVIIKWWIWIEMGLNVKRLKLCLNYSKGQIDFIIYFPHF